MKCETQPPCTNCRHAGTCSLPPTCHALRHFRQTGLPITPPRLNPCSQIEMEKSPSLPVDAKKPHIIERNKVFTSKHLETLMGTRHKKKRMEASHG